MTRNLWNLPRADAAEAGVDPEAILAFLDAVETARLELHSFMIVRHGTAIAEGWWRPHAPALPHALYSLSKSFCSTAVGLAIADGLFALDDTVVDLFRDDAPAQVGAHLAAMRVRDLLTMSTGHAVDTTGPMRSGAQSSWVKAFLEQPVEFEPGTHFLYNSGATYMLSALVQQKTGQRVSDYLRPRLFDPLGIGEARWETCPGGIDCGGRGLSVTTEDIAKFGQLYLLGGVSPRTGKQLIDPEWVRLATSRQVANGDDPDSDWNQGYGFQFWRCRHDAYRGDGAFGQYCIVMPDQDAVVAITSGLRDMGAVLRTVWSILLSAMGAEPLTDKVGVSARLSERTGALEIDYPRGRAGSPLAETVSGRAYRFGENALGITALTWRFATDGVALTFVKENGSDEIAAGYSDWAPSQTTLFFGRSEPAAGRAAWTSASTLEMTVSFNATPFTYSLVCRFDGEKVALDMRVNAGFGQTEWPTLHGTAEGE